MKIIVYWFSADYMKVRIWISISVLIPLPYTRTLNLISKMIFIVSTVNVIPIKANTSWILLSQRNRIRNADFSFFLYLFVRSRILYGRVMKQNILAAERKPKNGDRIGLQLFYGEQNFRQNRAYNDRLTLLRVHFVFLGVSKPYSERVRRGIRTIRHRRVRRSTSIRII